jgi:hypothetical protein
MVTVLLIAYLHGPHRKHRPSIAVSNCCRLNMFVCEAVSKRCCIFVYLALVAQQRVYMTQYYEDYCLMGCDTMEEPAVSLKSIEEYAARENLSLI